MKVIRLSPIVLATVFLFACSDGGDSNDKSQETTASAASDQQPLDAAQPVAIPTAIKGDAEAKALYQKTCIACHASGAAGAPRAGDTVAWDSLFEQQGLEGLLSSTINGKGAMPAKGLCGQCDSEDFKALILHMSGR